MGCGSLNESHNDLPNGNPNDNPVQQFNNYQNKIKRNRKKRDPNPDEENEDLDEDEDNPNSNRKKKKRGRQLLDNDPNRPIIEGEMLQDFKEMNKRKNRLKTIQKLREEIPFQHREGEEEYDPRISKPFRLGYEDEISNNNNYGRPVRLYDQVWLTYDFEIMADTTIPKVFCPPGWRIPTIDDYKRLIMHCGGNAKAEIMFTHNKLLKMDPIYAYVTSTKVNNDYNGFNKKAWIYKCIGFNRPEQQADINEGNQFLGNLQGNANTRKDRRINMQNDSRDYELISDDDSNEYKDNEFVYKTKQQLKENRYESKRDRGGRVPHYKSRSKSMITRKELIYNDEQSKLIFDSNPMSIYANVNKINQSDKLIYDVNIYNEQKTIRCKLIADEVLDLSFKCPLVIELNYRAFFELPILYNITTFEWDFNDKYCPRNYRVSDKAICAHVFLQPGEYDVTLKITLFSNRHFVMSKKVWVIPEIEYGEEEVIEGISYGQPIKLGKQVWLDRDLKKYFNYRLEEINLQRGKGPGQQGANSFIDSICACPTGWRLPYKDEFEELINFAGKNNDQRLYFFTMLEGAYEAEVSQAGFYNAVCLNFKPETNNKIKDEEGSREKNVDLGIIDPVFIEKLKQYDKVVLQTSTFSNIFQKEVYAFSIENNLARMGTRNTSMTSSKSFFSTRCIADNTFELDFGLKEDCFPIGFKIEFQLKQPNIIHCEWDFGDETIVIKKIKNPIHDYQRIGEYIVQCKLLLFGERVVTIRKMLRIYGAQETIGEKTKFVLNDQILILDLGDICKVRRNDQVHFSNQIAPIAPLINLNGFYIAFNDLNDNIMKCFKILLVAKTQAIKEHFKQPFYQLNSGVPCALCATSQGVAMLLKDSRDDDTLYLQVVTDKGEVYWRNNIMQNGAFPIKAEINQLMFYNNETEKPEFGMNSMFRPYSGRLAYGQNKILVIFSYENNFGIHNGQRNDNNGDTIVSYSEDGTEVHLVSSWSTTHSLAQRALWDGKNFFTASLGDAGPSNIKVVKIDPIIKMKINLRDIKKEINAKANVDESVKIRTQADRNENQFIPEGEIEFKFDHYLPIQNQITTNNELIFSNKKYQLEECDYLKNLSSFSKYDHATLSIRHNFISTNIVKGSIPSNLLGKTSGRFGSITLLGQNNIVATYSRIPCVDGGETNKENELGCIFFNDQLKVRKEAVYTEGDGVSCIKQARFGQNLLVVFSETMKYVYNRKYLIDTVDLIDTEEECCRAFLVNPAGKRISGVISFDANIFSPPDDMHTLIDGSAIWIFADKEDRLYLCLLCVEPTLKIVERFIKEVTPAGQLSTALKDKCLGVYKEKIKKEKEIFRSFGIDEEEEERRRNEYLMLLKEKEIERKKKDEEDKLEMKINHKRHAMERKQLKEEIQMEEELRKRKERKIKESEDHINESNTPKKWKKKNEEMIEEDNEEEDNEEEDKFDQDEEENEMEEEKDGEEEVYLNKSKRRPQTQKKKVLHKPSNNINNKKNKKTFEIFEEEESEIDNPLNQQLYEDQEIDLMHPEKAKNLYAKALPNAQKHKKKIDHYYM